MLILISRPNSTLTDKGKMQNCVVLIRVILKTALTFYTPPPHTTSPPHHHPMHPCTTHTPTHALTHAPTQLAHQPQPQSRPTSTIHISYTLYCCYTNEKTHLLYLQKVMPYKNSIFLGLKNQPFTLLIML